MLIFKRIIDFLMMILLIILFGYNIIGSLNHEIIGIITLSIFIVHNILNYKWYKVLFKGKYKINRIIQLIINLLLFSK